MKTHPRTLLGRRIKNLRKTRRLTQEALAEKANLHPKYVSSLERGKENPTLDVFLKLSNALGVELPELFSIEQEEADPRHLRKAITGLLDKESTENLQKSLKLLKAALR